MRTTACLVLGCGALLVGCGQPAGDDSGTSPARSSVGSSGSAGSGGAKASGAGGSGGGSASDPGTGGASAATGGSTGSGGSPAASTGGSSGGSSGGPSGSETDAGAPGSAGGDASAGDGGGGDPAAPATGLHKIFDGTTLNGWVQFPATDFAPKDGALVSTGVGRGWIATKDDYSHYRVIFSLKPGGTGGHAPTVLVFNTRAPEGQKGLDALGGIQFQPPNGGHWDYRPGKNNAGAGFTKVGAAGPATAGWHTCEIVANSATGEAKMACNGKDVLHYKDPTAGKKGPFAIQTHNAGITDAYKDISIEDNITSDAYTTVK